ncbi:MAG TPA: HAMP domain-containing sensor histidine kinase [Candidatus Polarisedimenticolaceae bacterium]|nr:HAMP domain-containing sensor histidine kinase [Candidatus Polarisedimenticolaceae bacterium]
MKRPTLIGQLFRVHTLVVTMACAALVLATMGASAILLREHQDETLEAIGVEVANGIEVEAAEQKFGMLRAAREYFAEAGLQGFRFELLDKEGHVAEALGKVADWDPDAFDVAINAAAVTAVPKERGAASGHFRACARWCGSEYVVRVVTTDVLHQSEVRRFGAVLLGALPVAAIVGALLGRALFSRRLVPLGHLEAAAAASAADPEVRLVVEANAREIATLQDSFNGLLARLGDALARERRFSQEASHELRTPLAAIRGRLERLVVEGSLSAPQAAHASHALREVDALNALVDALLLLARSEAAPLPQTPVNLCDLARAIGTRQSAMVDAPDEILVRGSEELLERAIANLVENARKFAGSEAHVRVRAVRNGTTATVTVDDDGPGVAESERASVFERFHRAPATRHTTDGVGLGLAVARAIVLRHRGTIDCGTSDLGGAAFRIVIPVLEEQFTVNS